MSKQGINLLLIDNLEANYDRLKNLLSEITETQFNLQWVRNLVQAKVALTTQNYDAYLINAQIDNFMDWCFQVFPQSTILITQDSKVGIQALEEGISDYLLEDQLSSILLEHSLRLTIDHSLTKQQLEKCQINYEVKLEQEEEKNQEQIKEILHTIFDHSTDGILLLDHEGIIYFANETVSELLNKPIAQLLGEQFGIPAQTDEKVEIEVCLLDQIEKILEMSHGIVQWEEEQGYVIVIRDITLHKQQEQELKNFSEHLEGLIQERTNELYYSEQMFRSLAENIKSVFWVESLIENQLSFIYVSPTYEEIWGQSPENLSQDYRYYLDSIHPDDLKIVVVNFVRQGEGETTEIEYRIFDNQGNLHWINTRSFPVYDDDNNLTQIVSISDDITEKKQAELELREARNQYQLLAESVPIGIYHNNAEGNCIYINEKTTEILDITLEECLGQGWINRIYPDDLDFVVTSWQEAFKNQSFWEREYRFVHRDGKVIWVLARCIFTFNEQGENTGSIGALTDITKQKELQQALTESQSLFQDVAANVPGAIFLYTEYPDGSNNVVYMSKGCEQLWEVYAEEVVEDATRIWEMVHPDDLAKLRESVLISKRDFSDWSCDFRLIVPSGKEKWVQGVGKPKLGADGAVVWNSLIIDITERKLIEEQIRINEARLRMALEVAEMICWEANLENCKVEEWGEYIAKCWYLDSFPVTDQKPIIHPEDKSKINRLIEGAIANKGEFEVEHRFILPDQQISWFLSKARMICNNGNCLDYFVGVTININERKQTEIILKEAKKKAEVANEAKSMFIANMSHELRTPLNAILGFTQLMKYSNNLLAQYQEYVKIINQAGEHLLSLINEILDLSKIESGEIELNLEVFDLDVFLESIEQLFSIKITAKNLTFLIIKESTVPQYIKADQSKLKSIILNLINNAIKFTHQGNICLKISSINLESQINLIFAIEDTGMGIAPEELENLFEPFSQTESGKKSGEGSGLGLAISKRLINSMNGEIRVTSKVNKGSIFTFNIPCELGYYHEISPSQFLKNKVGIGLKSNQPQYRILIVEDNPINAKLLGYALEKYFQLQFAINGEEAIKLWQEWQPDLIFMDIMMPIMDGYQAIQAIRHQEQNTHNRPVKIIVITAVTIQSEQEKLISLGCDDFLSKPLNITELWEKLAINLGVELEYQNQSAISDTIASRNLPEQIKPQDLLFMGYDWRERLFYSALSARTKKIKTIINEIPIDKANLINSLEFLINQLNFEQLMYLANLDQDNSN